MKKNNLLLMLIMLAAVIVMPMTASAAGEAYAGFYDFDDYTEEVKGNQPVRPDKFILGTSYGFPSAYMGSADCSAEGRGRVFAIPRGEATLLFDEKLMDGKLHISYDAKLTSPELNMLTLFWNDMAGTGNINLNETYSKSFFINKSGQNTLNYYSNMTTWALNTFDASFNSTEWHRFDIIASGITETGSKVSTYVDGRLMNNAHTFVGSNGIFGLTFRVSYNTETAPPLTEMVYIDNLNVRHYYNDTALAAVSADGERILTSDAKIRVRLSERVDKTLLTKQNISVGGVSNIPSYTIENVTDTGFDIVFASEIPYGKYKINLSPSVTGEITKTSLKYPLEVKTEEIWAEAAVDFADYDFNSYSGGGVLPDGFVSANGSENSYAVAEQNSSVSDYALGFKGFEASNRTRTNMFIPFEATPELGKEYSVEFDIKSKDMRWYLYLAEEGDIADGEIANAAIGADENGVLKYAKGSSSSVTDSVVPENITLTEDEWHNIKLTVETDTELKKTVYKLTVDDGEEYTMETTRKLHEIITEGIGLGYQERAEGAELYIDNIKVSGNTKVKYPEVESITLYDVNGNEVTGQTVTTMIKSAEVKYNTYISDSCYDYIKLYADSVRTDYNYEIAENEDKTNSVIIYFDNMLEPLTEYKIIAETGLESKFSSTAKAYTTDSVLFYTLKDVDYSINKLEYDADASAATVEFVKNNNESGSYIFAVCAYKNTDVEVNGETKTVKKLAGMNLMSIEISAESLGVITYTLPLDLGETEVDEIVPYLWNYPNLADVKING